MLKRSLITYFLIAFCACQLPVFGQKPVTIKLDNPSFEDYPGAAHTPQGWFDCGFAGESAPDVQPSGTFSVNKAAFHGSTYIGMVVRDNNTWEAIGQRLKSPLLKGVTYTFSLYAARSELYMSKSQLTGKDANYITPATVRIWAGSGYCAKEEMLDETEPVSEGNWKKFTFKFTPKATLSYFMIEGFYKVPTLFPYNGNVLVDNASDIVPEKKDEPKKPADVVAAVVKEKPKVIPPPIVKPKEKPAKSDSQVIAAIPTKKKEEPKKEEPKKEEENLSPDRLREGQTIKIEKLQFEPNSSKIQEISFASLDEIYSLLLNNSNLIVEIGGHTNLVMEEVASLRLSTARAKSVADYLVQKGIERKRLAIKGYGRSKPIANEQTQVANKINQRVEIKILSTNG
ncbi:MAG: OmpA family protein [Saprospiraceae bacterium]|nr:OmpA family protein [Saprospiraceae bacterium]